MEHFVIRQIANGWLVEDKVWGQIVSAATIDEALARVAQRVAANVERARAAALSKDVAPKDASRFVADETAA